MWSHHNLLTEQKRLLWLEKTTTEHRIKLSDDLVRLLERFSPEFRERHIETRHTGEAPSADVR